MIYYERYHHGGDGQYISGAAPVGCQGGQYISGAAPVGCQGG